MWLVYRDEETNNDVFVSEDQVAWVRFHEDDEGDYAEVKTVDGALHELDLELVKRTSVSPFKDLEQIA